MPKRSFTPEEIVERLQGKGMTFNEDDEPLKFFRAVPYYRFRGYFLEYVDENNRCIQYGKRLNHQIPFQYIRDRYHRDSIIRNTLLEPITSFEVFLRAALVEILGKNSEYEYTQKSFYDIRRADKLFNRGRTNSYWDVWEQKLRLAKFLCPESVKLNYPNDIPIWAIIGHMDFGALEVALNMLKDEHVNIIRDKLGYTSRRLLVRHIAYVRNLRNLCSHHEQLWRHDIKTEYLRNGNFPSVQLPWFSEYRPHSSQLYGLILLLFYYNLKTGAAVYAWLPRLVNIFRDTMSPEEAEQGYGFPLDWLEQQIWAETIPQFPK